MATFNPQAVQKVEDIRDDAFFIIGLPDKSLPRAIDKDLLVNTLIDEIIPQLPAPTPSALADVLLIGNTTGASNILVNAGQNVSFGGTLTNYITHTGAPTAATEHYAVRGIDMYVGSNGFFSHNFNGGLTAQNVSTTKGISLVPLSDTITVTNGIGQQGNLDFSALATSNKTWTLPNATGTIALTSDINSLYNINGTLSGYRTLDGNGNGLTFETLDFFKVDFDDTISFDYTSGGTLFELSPSGGAAFAVPLDATELKISKAATTQQRITFKDSGATVFDGILQNADLTAVRTWTLPDNSGTIALTSDIPAASGLGGVLGVSNTTSGSNLDVTTGDFLRLQSSDGFYHRFTMPIGATGLNHTVSLQSTGGTLAYLTDIPDPDPEIHNTRDIGNTSGDPSVNSTDHVCFYLTTGGGGSINLPTVAAGREIILIRTSGTDAADVAGTGGANVNGAATFALPTTLYSRTTLISDGTDWFTQ